MKRRSALAALACVVASSPAGAQASAPVSASTSAPARSGVFAWGPQGCWIDAGEGALSHLPDRLAPGIAPGATADGLWLVTASGALHCWEADTVSSWRLRCAVELAVPVHALATSPDGCWVLAAHGEQLSLLDARGRVAKTFEGTDLQRSHRGPATVLFMLPQRRSFAAAWPALGELWEIPLDPGAEPIFDGLVHDYRLSEGIATPGYLGARRAPLGRPLPAFSFADERVAWLAGMQDNEVVVVHLDVRRRIAALRVDAANPAGATLRPASRERGPAAWWLPAGNEVQVFDASRWVRLAVHALPGPVRQLQAVDDAVWALVGEHRAADLFVLRDGNAGGWKRMGGLAGPSLALRREPRGSRLLALRADPPALLMLDSGGSVLRTWPLPPATAMRGAGWIPMA